MFGAWMDAPKVDVHDINHDTDMPRPDLTGVTNDSAALIAAYNTCQSLLIALCILAIPQLILLRKDGMGTR